MVVTLQEQANEVLSLFNEGFLQDFLDENKDILTDIIFFGSFMKGKNHAESDLDMILVPTVFFREENKENVMEIIQTLLGLHDDLHEGLVTHIPLDVKLQEFDNKEEQYGMSYRTGNALATFYSFIKGEIGEVAVLNSEKELAYSKL